MNQQIHCLNFFVFKNASCSFISQSIYIMYIITLHETEIQITKNLAFHFVLQFNNIFEAKSVFEQVTFSLAVAEEALQFEHRDLHWGNVLVKKTELKFHEYVVMGQTFQVESHGVHVSIIDFTLSRLVKGMFILPEGSGMIKG